MVLPRTLFPKSITCADRQGDGILPHQLQLPFLLLRLRVLPFASGNGNKFQFVRWWKRTALERQ
jgi:hypothetical protein